MVTVIRSGRYSEVVVNSGLTVLLFKRGEKPKNDKRNN